MSGEVIFIGAGPGDPELLTLKAYKIIRKAEVIIYAGSLVNPDILKFAPSEAKIYNSAHLDLDEILNIMEEEVAQDHLVARLHTGDPSIYGAIGEQISFLKKKKIPYKIIPGVSSLFASSAALETELTLPEISQTVIITRPEGRTPKPAKESLSSLAQHQTTMCIFLGVQQIRKVVEDLLSYYPEHTPVAVVQKASWKEEKILRGRLEDIVSKVEQAGIKKTAIIIVGQVLHPDRIIPSKLYAPDFTHEYREGEGN